MKSFLRTTACAVLVGGALLVNSPSQARSAQEPSTAADNTKMNKHDRAKGKLTADQQSQSASDRGTTRKIRQAVMGDKSLSTYAHNMKIITRDGMVTLRGPVRSEEERQAVEAKAKEVAGNDKVTDDLKIARKKKS